MSLDNDTQENELLAEVRAGLNLFSVALKNHALYPEANHTRRASLEKAHNWLKDYLERESDLHLTVDRDSLIFQDEVAFQDKAGEQPLVFPLFRDGVQWIEFDEGLTFEELNAFAGLMNRFRTLKEEAGDDLVTAMWDADFAHIKYKTAEEFWENDPLIDIAALKAANEELEASGAGRLIKIGSRTVDQVLGVLNKDQSGQGQSADGGQAAPPSGVAAPTEEEASPLFSELLSNLKNSVLKPKRAGQNLLDTVLPNLGSGEPTRPLNAPVYIDDSASSGQEALPGPVNDEDDSSRSASEATARNLFKAATYYDSQGRDNFWKLSPEEEAVLAAMISDEEHRNRSQDCLEILTILLDESQAPGDARDGRQAHGDLLNFMAAEIRHDLELGDFAFIRGFLETLKEAVKTDKPFLARLVAEFQAKIAAGDVLDALLRDWPQDQATDRSFAELRLFLYHLPPEAIQTFVALLLKGVDPRIEKILVEVSAVAAAKLNSLNVVKLITPLRSASLREMIQVVKNRQLPCPTVLLQGLSHYEIPQVREEAARALLEADPDNIRHLAHLIDDPHLSINRLICAYLALRRIPLAEKLLFDYLNESYLQGRAQSKEHLLNCYRAFGLCSSSWVISFLREILFKKDWKSLLGLEGNWHQQGAALALMMMPERWGAAEILDEAAHSRFRSIRQAWRSAESLRNQAAW
ncbi:MAG: hypothetical protein LBP33_05595 [Candidatus Adiutrix sp.]|jgi:hypothetical protein|nr:hypothetical protein [Candidatus Adiutrix sp.]